MSRNPSQIIDEQMFRWTRFRGGAETLEPGRAKPCITMSPQMGSLGLGVAKKLAETLQFDLYERELVELIAQTANVRRHLVESVDEHTQGAIEAWMARQLGFLAESDYVTNLSRVLLTLSHHGKAVVVGRGAQFVLDPASTLRIRIVAPFESRVQRVAKRDELTADQARAKVLGADADRAAFVRRHFDRDLEDARNYDLVLNTERLSIETCAELAQSAFKGRFG
jgi:cytidylate kinase